MRRAGTVKKAMVRRAVAAGGNCTGEHGVGFSKIDSVEAEGGIAVHLMAAIKRAFAPRT